MQERNITLTHIIKIGSLFQDNNIRSTETFECYAKEKAKTDNFVIYTFE